jgi:opacity protein-like surface antigen
LNIRMVSCFSGASLLLATSVGWAEPFDFYVGAGVGESTVQSNAAPFIPTSVEQHPTGWKAFAGWRPIDMFSAEVEYADFGSKSGSSGTTSQHASGDAVAAFAVGYLPVPLPILDIYGKVGLANVHRSLDNTPSGFLPVSLSNSSTVFAYGAGVQLKFGAPAVRLEYEGFTTSGGDQSLFSLDFAWNF